MANSESLSLKFGLSFDDLYRREGLVRIDAAFADHLRSADAELFNRSDGSARSNFGTAPRKQQSELMVDLAPHVEDFHRGSFLDLRGEVRALQARHDALAPVYALKRRFIQKKAISGVTPEKASAINGQAVAKELEALFGEPLTEASFVDHVSRWLEDEANHGAQLAVAAQYGAWAALSHAGREKHDGGVLFKVPHKLDMTRLIPVETLLDGGIARLALPQHEWRHREGFKLTDPGMGLNAALDQANYCIKCHNQEKDSCSTGLKEKTGEFKKSFFGVTLAGCPLDEKISEMNLVKQSGQIQSARLAIAAVDNPMCAGTGHQDLQRLHEVLHISEAGSGGYPAGGNADAQRCSGTALGLRNL